MLLLSATITTSSASVEINQQAPDFTLTSIYGTSVTLSNYRGRVILLDFWATWCGPCREEIPELSQLYSTYKDQGLEIISIDLQEKPSDVRAFAKQNGMVWTVVVDLNGTVADEYGIEYIPTLVLIDTKGKISCMHIGLTEESVLASEVEEVPYIIGNLSSAISVEISEQVLLLGQAIGVQGALQPPLPSVSVKITYNRPDGIIINKVVMSFASGLYNDSFVPDMAGSWALKASWNGDPNYAGAETNLVSFVVKAPTTITISPLPLAYTIGTLAVVMIGALFIVRSRKRRASPV